MKILAKTAFAAAFAVGALAAPAAAQVNGIATVELPIVVANSQAFQSGYQQVATTYQAQRTTIEQRQQRRQELLQTFDTNRDGQLSEAEAAATQDPNNATVQQIQAIDQEVQQLQGPINRARIYVVQQVAQQYSPSLQQVISDRNIQMVLSPDAFIYLPEGADVTQSVIDVLNTRIPSVAAVPPAEWQPSEAAVNLYQQIQQILMLAAVQQQQAAAAQAQSGQTATSGR